MFLLHRCQHCGNLCTKQVDDVYLCDSVECEAALLVMPRSGDQVI